MRRFSIRVVIALMLCASVAIPAYAANFPLLDPSFSIVPKECTSCPCNYFALLQLIQNLMNAAIAIGIIAFVIVITVAGASFMLNPTNPEARNQAKSMLLNVVIGMVIVLTAWLVVDFVMKMLYNPDATLNGSEKFGPWNEILSSKDNKWCIESSDAKPIPGILGGIAGTLAGNHPGSTGGGVGGPPTPATRGVCTPSGLQSMGWPTSLATKMSCVTRYENGSCNTSAPSSTDIGSDGNSVSIGLFQVNISAHDMNYPACTTLNGGQPLNCKSAFVNGPYTSSNHRTRVSNFGLYQTCRAVASNPACNTAAAIEIYNAEGIGAWGSAAQNSCRGL